MVELSELDDDVHEELLSEFSGPIFNGLVEVNKELDDQLDNVIVDLVILDDKKELLEELHAFTLVGWT